MPLLLISLLFLFSSLACSTVPRKTVVLTDSQGFSTRLEMAGIPEFPSGSSSLYFTGPQWLERIKTLISEAESYILIDTFLFTDSPASRLVFDLLQEKMLEGVKVYCIVDSASYYRATPEGGDPVPALLAYIRSLGIPLVEYNPINGYRFFTLFNLLDRDHRKFWVIDGKTIVVGGQNVDLDSLRSPEEKGGVDTMIETYSPAGAAFLTNVFTKTWNAFSNVKLTREYFLTNLPEESEILKDIAADEKINSKVWIADQGLRNGGVVSDVFEAFFASAEEELFLVQCYAFITPSLKKLVQGATDRGVSVHVILSNYHVIDRARTASFYGIKALQDAGATVYLYDSPSQALLHYKLFFMDGLWSGIGSANFNFRSQTTSREIMAIYNSPEVAQIVADNLQKIVTLSRIVSREEALEYQGLSYFLGHLLMQFGG